MSDVLWYVFGYSQVAMFAACLLRDPDGGTVDLVFAVVLGILWPLLPAGIIGRHVGIWVRSYDHH